MVITLPPKYASRTTLSPDEVAEVLGIHHSTLYRHIMPYVWDRTILSFKIGARRLIVITSLDAFLEEQAQKAA